jgi:hypothetical protein
MVVHCKGAQRIAQAVSSRFNRRIELNPTLVHHGLATAARWHVVTANKQVPLADLYRMTSREAAHVAEEIATVLKLPVMLLSNRGAPKALADHVIVRSKGGHFTHGPRSNPTSASALTRVPRVGEVWTDWRTGVKCKVTAIRGSRLEYLVMGSGERLRESIPDFVATHRPQASVNPRGRKGRPWITEMAEYHRDMGREDFVEHMLKAMPATGSLRTELRIAAGQAWDREHAADARKMARERRAALEAFDKEYGSNPRRPPNTKSWKAGDRFKLYIDITTHNRHQHAKGEMGTVTMPAPDAALPGLYVVFDSTPHVAPEYIPTRWALHVRGSSRNPGHRGRKATGARRARKGPRTARARRNPRHLSERSRAEAQFKKWQDRPDARGRFRKMKGPTRVPRHLAGLGELVEVVYESNKYDGKKKLYKHRTKRPRPVLATDPDGRHVFVVGGNMKVTADGLVN